MTRGVRRGLAIAAVGVVGLLGLNVLGAQAGDSQDPITTPGVSVERSAWTEFAAQPAAAGESNSGQEAGNDRQLRQKMLDMLEDRMGLSPKEAEEQVDGMLEHMGQVHGDQAGRMIDACGAGDATGKQGRSTGMMGGSGGSMMGGSGGSMMGGSSL